MTIDKFFEALCSYSWAVCLSNVAKINLPFTPSPSPSLHPPPPPSHPPHPPSLGLNKRSGLEFRARICKRLRRPGIDSEDSIPPAYVAWRAGTTNRVVLPVPPGWESIPGLLKRFTHTGSGRSPYIARVGFTNWSSFLLLSSHFSSQYV